MKLWNKNISLSSSNILCDLNDLDWENSSCLISKLSKFIWSCCSVLRARHIVVCKLMLISHWNPSNPVNSRPFPFIHHNIESMMSISTCRLKQIVNFFIDNLNISNFDWIWKIAWRSISSSMLLRIRKTYSISLIFEYIEYIVRNQRNKSRIGPASFHTMSFTRPGCSKTEYRHINSFNKSSNVWRKSSIKDLCHCVIRGIYLLAVKFFFYSVVDVQNANSVSIDANVFSLVTRGRFYSDLGVMGVYHALDWDTVD